MVESSGSTRETLHWPHRLAPLACIDRIDTRNDIQGFSHDRALHMSFSHDHVMNGFEAGHLKNSILPPHLPLGIRDSTRLVAVHVRCLYWPSGSRLVMWKSASHVKFRIDCQSCGRELVMYTFTYPVPDMSACRRNTRRCGGNCTVSNLKIPIHSFLVTFRPSYVIVRDMLRFGTSYQLYS